MPAANHVAKCTACGRYFQWLLIRYGRRLPFDYTPRPVADVPDDEAWAPGMWKVYGKRQAAMAPLGDSSRTIRAEAKVVYTIHRCPSFERHIADVFAYIRNGQTRRA